MDSVVKIAAIAISGVLCIAVIKKQVPEIALVLSLAVGALILLCILPVFSRIKQLLGTLGETAGIEAAILIPVIKCTGIAIITKVTAGICTDAKESGVAAFVEIAGAAGALYVCLPLMEMVLSMVSGLL